VQTLRIGIVGLGANARLRHVPGLRACPGVEIAGVCNRTPRSTRDAAAAFGIPHVYDDWRELASDPQLDAVVVGTWPSLHCEVAVHALEAGKHVLTEARMARDEHEARRMLEASRRHPQLVAQIVPSPFGLRVHRVVLQLLADGFLGRLQEVVVLGVVDALADPAAPRHWRQSRRDSGLNMLALGILHETLTRWLPQPRRVYAQGNVFTPLRPDPHSGAPAPVEIPDALHVLAEWTDGARGLYHLSNVAHFGAGMQIRLYGSEGTLQVEFGDEERLLGGRRGDAGLRSLAIPDELAGRWRVEEEFIGAIRGREPVRFTDFATGVRYMEFTAAVARSLAARQPQDLP
jgi:predicted dehydrogenase